MAVAAESGCQLQYFVDSLQNRCGIQNLRTDVAAHARRNQIAEVSRASIYRGRIINRDPELVLAQASRNVGVGRGIDIRVYANRKIRLDPTPGRERVN